MKRLFLTFGMILMTATTTQAGGLISKMSSSVQLTVESARSTAVRVGNSYSISGSGINTTDGTTAGSVSAGTITSGIYSPGTISATQATDGNAFTYSTSFTQGDAIPTAAPTVGDVPNFSNVTSYTAGVAGTLAGTVGTSGALTVTAGGAGTTATGQFVSEITVID
tara:strand:- start:206 stop:703 length:498 start_codon:yes stop_codon:yes gene_type:complete